MKAILLNNLYEYIKENNPDILLALEETGDTTKYLSDKVNSIDSLVKQLTEQGKPQYIIEETCINALTKDLNPSRYYYILRVLESEFEEQYNLYTSSGLLLFEISNMIKECNSVFDDLNFAEENEDNRFLRYAITGVIKEYLENVTSENVSDELQQSTETER